jgi:DNA-binding NtrC family response regulator
MSKTLRDLKRDFERTVVMTTLTRHAGDRDLTAKVLGITRRALDKILERHHLVKRRYTLAIPMPQEAEQPEKQEETEPENA